MEHIWNTSGTLPRVEAIKKLVTVLEASVNSHLGSVTTIQVETLNKNRCVNIQYCVIASQLVDNLFRRNMNPQEGTLRWRNAWCTLLPLTHQPNIPITDVFPPDVQPIDLFSSCLLLLSSKQMFLNRHRLMPYNYGYKQIVHMV